MLSDNRAVSAGCASVRGGGEVVTKILFGCTRESPGLISPPQIPIPSPHQILVSIPKHRLIPFHFIPSRPIPPHPIHLVLSPLIPYHIIPSHPIISHDIVPYPIVHNMCKSIAFHRLPPVIPQPLCYEVGRGWARPIGLGPSIAGRYKLPTLTRQDTGGYGWDEISVPEASAEKNDLSSVKIISNIWRWHAMG